MSYHVLSCLIMTHLVNHIIMSKPSKFTGESTLMHDEKHYQARNLCFSGTMFFQHRVSVSARACRPRSAKVVAISAQGCSESSVCTSKCQVRNIFGRCGPQNVHQTAARVRFTHTSQNKEKTITFGAAPDLCGRVRALTFDAVRLFFNFVRV